MSAEDKAQEHEAQIWAIHNRPREVLHYAPSDPGYGPAECEECGSHMHPVRRSYGYTVCVNCAAAAEKLSARRR